MNGGNGFVVFDFAGVLFQGLLMTLAISAIGIIGSVVVGILGASLIALKVPVAAQVVRVYVETIRNTPLLVQVFFLFFVLPSLGLTLGAFAVGCVSLIAWGGAYNVENFRAGFAAVGSGYREGARALGFSQLGTFQFVEAPIGLRLAIPGLTNTLISVLKNSALMLGISLAELTFVVQRLSAETFRTVELYIVLGAVYLLLVFGLSGIMHAVDRRFALKAGV
jgi:His/Glu/Gln/Arg/opine family amino acid ABC transporter permease subunit